MVSDKQISTVLFTEAGSNMTRQQARDLIEALRPLIIEDWKRELSEKPTEEMLNAARDWSAIAVGRPIGNDAATGCWTAMFRAMKG